MIKFEYLETTIIVEYVYNAGEELNKWNETKLLSPKLNEYGKKGWQLVSLVEKNITPIKTIFIIVFMRKIIKRQRK